MKEFFTLEYGIGGACVLLTLQILIKVGEFLWKLRQKKDDDSDTAIAQLTKALAQSQKTAESFDIRFLALERTLSELPKFRTDLRRYFNAVKAVAGDKWPQIRDEIMKEDTLAHD